MLMIMTIMEVMITKLVIITNESSNNNNGANIHIDTDSQN